MKKLYSLFAVAFLAASFSAQGTESFTNVTAPANSYAGGNYTGDNNVSWTFAGARKVTSTDNITATSVGFDSSGTRSVSASSGANGVGSVTYTVRSYFTGGTAANRTIQVYVNGTMYETFTLSAMSTNYTRTVSANVPGNVTIEFRSTGSRQIVLDDVSWTSAGALGVADSKGRKEVFIKNTSVDQEIHFGLKADVKIFNVNGQLIKTASVNENGTLNVIDLQRGIYIVAGNINGKAVSEKIIKR
ncbi:T9SS type A sorting domain-containing protein [Chryseobacterium herbae]|uniref:T9SS type A sorting domain-containing protein n=1 Tax=Chryseobacterium herbae TaxID=2976476 RepID=A0ABT2IVJ5_9FLAO|nr:T9SS type A sorting domain-containing protein [Chryseobacterium sp. pc1-10]MCT2562625.1 T9SS type A sorting domain-containing protein [Chryseobacterium sp. pc1-10]